MPKGIPNKRYTPEFKKMVIETMQQEKLSYRETTRRFGINDHKRIMAWERIYLEEGPEGFCTRATWACQQDLFPKGNRSRSGGGSSRRGTAAESRK